MLKQRLLTAVVLIPLFLGAVFAPTALFAMVVSVVVLLGAWEWSALSGLKQRRSRLVLVAVIAAAMAAAWYAAVMAGGVFVFIGALLWWLFGFKVIAVYRGDHAVRPLSTALAGVLILVPAWLALIVLHSAENGPASVLFLFVLIWTADTGAYFVGRRFGKRKLAPQVSPGKSWEGALGALALTAMVAYVGGRWFGVPDAHLLLFVSLALVTIVFSIAGDLMESLYKRRAGVKDSGHLLPGHGGVLDRIDSMTAAAPVFALGKWILENVA